MKFIRMSYGPHEGLYWASDHELTDGHKVCFGDSTYVYVKNINMLVYEGKEERANEIFQDFGYHELRGE